jgi:hypothetical protein
VETYSATSVAIGERKCQTTHYRSSAEAFIGCTAIYISRHADDPFQLSYYYPIQVMNATRIAPGIIYGVFQVNVQLAPNADPPLTLRNLYYADSSNAVQVYLK